VGFMVVTAKRTKNGRQIRGGVFNIGAYTN
jgi:hypothetical protein